MEEVMERQIGFLVFITETDRDETKQEIRVGQEHREDIMEILYASLAANLGG
jgi:hypothetical protein